MRDSLYIVVLMIMFFFFQKKSGIDIHQHAGISAGWKQLYALVYE